MLGTTANLDISLNNAWDKASRILSEEPPSIAPAILEPMFGSYAYFFMGTDDPIVGVPMLAPTAAVGVNPWDHVFGPLGEIPPNVVARQYPDQSGEVSI